MRCQDFNAQIDDLLSGVVQPEANQHMLGCERCSSHLRTRATVQSGLRKLATSPLPGPSKATDVAVMEAFRRLQQLPAAGSAKPARVLTFPGKPGRAAASVRLPHMWWGSGAAAAVIVLAMLGSGIRPGRMTSGSTAKGSGSSSVTPVSVTPVKPAVATASLSTPHTVSPRTHFPAKAAADKAAGAELASARRVSPGVAHAGAANAVAEPQSDTSPLVHLASATSSTTAAGTEIAAAPGSVTPGSTPGSTTPGSTWPGYNNLMYCDPVVCSGPMQVVHIQVPANQLPASELPAGQVPASNVGSGGGDGLVNADVVVGPDGVARAIRVVN